jgi:hypothetical protein
MDLHLNNPDLQAKLDRWVAETGRGPDELVEDAFAGYFEELAQTRDMLDSRYDDLKSGRVKPISRDELIAHFREKSAAHWNPVRFMITYDFHPEVERDLDEIWDFIAADNHAAAGPHHCGYCGRYRRPCSFPRHGPQTPGPHRAASALH